LLDHPKDTPQNGLRDGAGQRLTFSFFSVDLQTEELWKGDARVRIQRQPFQVLAVLLETPGQTVSREALQRRLWGEQVNVDFDLGLNAAVKKLREALEDPSDAPLYIQTISRKGYRFVAAVQQSDPLSKPKYTTYNTEEPFKEADVPTAGSHALVKEPPSRTTWSKVAIAFSVPALILCALAFDLPKQAISVPKVTQLTHSARISIGNIDDLGFPASVTDGSRIFYTVTNNGHLSLMSVSVNGGTETTIPSPSGLLEPEISDISHDGTKLLVVDVGSGWTEHPIWIIPASGGSGRRFADTLAHAATWTEDGLHIVFGKDDNLFIADENGAQLTQLAVLPGRAYWLRWAPDNRQLSFTLVASITHATSLWAVDFKGQSLHQLSANPSASSSDCCASWLPNSMNYVFESNRGGFGFIGDVWSDSVGSRFLIRNSGPRRITNGPTSYQSPISSRSGDRAFFAGESVFIEDRIFDPIHNEFIPYLVDDQPPTSLAFSNDGKWIAWIRPTDSTLWRSSSGGAERIELVPSPLQVGSVRWSPDAAEIAFAARQPGGAWKVFVVSSAGGKPRPILPGDLAAEKDPDWSPTGKTLAFTSISHSSKRETSRLVSIDLSTSQTKVIVNSEGMTNPRYSPDGASMSALSNGSIMLLNMKGSDWKRLSDRVTDRVYWSHSGEVIFLQAVREVGQPIYRIAILSGNEQMVSGMAKLAMEDYSKVSLIGLASEDRPVIAARLTTANIFSYEAGGLLIQLSSDRPLLSR
jgi:Tol biopolymer transport system component/DNA-binding winged helix-turn-helix (wHTH) protein